MTRRMDAGFRAPKSCHIAVLRPFFRADCGLCRHSTELRTERNRAIEEHLAHVAEVHEQNPGRLAGAVTRLSADLLNVQERGLIS